MTLFGIGAGVLLIYSPRGRDFGILTPCGPNVGASLRLRPTQAKKLLSPFNPIFCPSQGQWSPLFLVPIVPQFPDSLLPPTRRKALVSLPQYCQLLLLIFHFCLVRTEQYSSLSHPENSCLPLCWPTALSCPCLAGLNPVECTDPSLFPSRSNPTLSPPPETLEVTEG